MFRSVFSTVLLDVSLKLWTQMALIIEHLCHSTMVATIKRSKNNPYLVYEKVQKFINLL